MDARILLVVPPGRRLYLLKSLEEDGVEIALAAGFQEAVEKLGASHWNLVITDAEIAGGSWRHLLEIATAIQHPPEVIVCSRCGDEQLWAEVIQCGAFDLIPEPYEKQEILRIVHSALDSHYLRRFTHSQARAL